MSGEQEREFGYGRDDTDGGRDRSLPGQYPLSGTLRPAQKRVIDGIVAKSETQRRVCVVAAPGCGRRDIGLETIRRLGEPALIMSPSTQTADDWKDRFVKDYLPEGEDVKKWVSRDASVKAPLISVTYQALHAVLNSKKPLANWLKTAKIGTVLLDDPHHLRPEYWKVVEEIRKDACTIFQAVGGSGLSRVDFFVENGTGEVVFNEINTFPGFTSISMYPMLWERQGLNIKELVDELIRLGFERNA